MNASCLRTGGPVCQINQFFLYTNMEEYHLRYHDDVYTDSFHVLFLQEPLNFQALSTPMRFQKYAISLSSQTHRFIRVHTTVLMRFQMSTRMKTIELHVVT